MRISDWSSDVCSSDLYPLAVSKNPARIAIETRIMPSFAQNLERTLHNALGNASKRRHEYATLEHLLLALIDDEDAAQVMAACGVDLAELAEVVRQYLDQEYQRSEEHTSELQSLMRISYAVFCLKKKNNN